MFSKKKVHQHPTHPIRARTPHSKL